ncbi:hypothetical protein Scep_027500 [Stephania cephalantha]|uniref:Uncharacterized protein n=1 Tax=Stephania cephalantha TaxID=152367 RepID=A0AAP0EFK7_9MAGN
MFFKIKKKQIKQTNKHNNKSHKLNSKQQIIKNTNLFINNNNYYNKKKIKTLKKSNRINLRFTKQIKSNI